MNRRLRNLAIVTTAIAAVLLVASTLTSGARGERSPSDPAARQPVTEASALPAGSSLVETPAPGSHVSATSALDTRTYAIAVSELQGLPPDAPPGTKFELWVAWDPPVTKRPKAGVLLEMVQLEKIVPPVTRDGLAAAILRVPADRMRDVIYSDRYGAFAVAILP